MSAVSLSIISPFNANVDDATARKLVRLHHIIAVLDAALDANAEAVMWLRANDDHEAIDLVLRSWTASHALDRDMNIETSPADPSRNLTKCVDIYVKDGLAIQRVATVYWPKPAVKS